MLLGWFSPSCFCISVWLLCISRMLWARQFCLKKRRYIRTISEYKLYRTFSHLFDYFTTFPWNCFYKWQFSFQNQNDEYKRNDHKCDCFSLKMEIEVFVRFFLFNFAKKKCEHTKISLKTITNRNKNACFSHIYFLFCIFIFICFKHAGMLNGTTCAPLQWTILTEHHITHETQQKYIGLITLNFMHESLTLFIIVLLTKWSS